jgi:hypothetical protein
VQFADQQALSTAYLILRHLYDGDVIDWPVDDAHPLRAIFAQLELEGYVARWDRIWPLHDRYRLTDLGIATIEAQYRPANSQKMFDDLRAMNMNPYDRRAYLQSAGYDPYLWPILHDPYNNYNTYGYDPSYRSSYYSYVWEDNEPTYRHRHYQPSTLLPDDTSSVAQPLHNVDLDRDAAAAAGAVGLAHTDLDVS